MPLFPSHAEIQQRQLSQLGTLLAAIETNPFYRDRVQTFGERLGLKSVTELAHQSNCEEPPEAALSE